jgi:ribokinase
MDHPAARVIVVGSINVDLIVGVERLPRPGETVNGRRFVRQGGGKGANQAAAAARAGASVALVGAVGDDDLAGLALANLAEAGVDLQNVTRLPGEHTGLALIVVDAAGENQIAVASGANARLDAAMAIRGMERAGAHPGSVCLLGFEVEDEVVVATARWTAARGIRLLVNPAPARPIPSEVLAARPILTPNEIEAALLTGARDAATSARLLGTRSAAPVVISLGGEGAMLWSDGVARAFAALPVEPVDTTGAGDALNGVLAAELVAGAPLEDALRWAMAGAALSTMTPGAQAGLPTRAQIAALLEDEPLAAARPGGHLPG